MRKNLNKKIAAVAVGALVMTGTGVAYAYWTTSGSGSGKATVGSDAEADAIKLTQAEEITGLFPGSVAQDIVVTASNPAAYSQKVGEVNVAVTYSEDCPVGNWTFSQVEDAFGILAAANDSDTDENTLTVGSIALKDTASNQDLCKGDVPTFAFTSAASE